MSGMRWVLVVLAVAAITALSEPVFASVAQVDIRDLSVSGSDVGPTATLLELSSAAVAETQGYTETEGDSENEIEMDKKPAKGGKDKSVGDLAKAAVNKAAALAKDKVQHHVKKLGDKALKSVVKAAEKAVKGSQKEIKKQEKKIKKALKATLKKLSHASNSTAKKLQKKLRRLVKSEKKLAKKKLKKSISKAAERAIRICRAKVPKLTGTKLEQCIERLKRAGVRVLKKQLGLQSALNKVKDSPTRANIQKAQALLKRHGKGPIRVKVKGHTIRLRPASPRRKKQKRFAQSQQLENYKLHLRKQARELKAQIKDLKLDLHALRSPPTKDWPLEYGYLDPPDESMAKISKRLQSDLKPFLKDAKSIKQKHLDEGRAALPTMEKMRWKVHNFMDDAKRLPLLPAMYRFVE